LESTWIAWDYSSCCRW